MLESSVRVGEYRGLVNVARENQTARVIASRDTRRWLYGIWFCGGAMCSSVNLGTRPTTSGRHMRCLSGSSAEARRCTRQ